MSGKHRASTLLLVLAASCTPHERAPIPTRLPSSGDGASSGAGGAGSASLALSPGAAASAAQEPPEPPAPPMIAPEGTTTYEIDQAIDDIGGTFAGKATITYTNQTGAPITNLPLIVHPNAATELGVGKGETGGLAVEDVSVVGSGKATLVKVRPTLVTVRLSPAVPARARIVLNVRYGGHLRKLPPDANDMFSQAMGSMGSISGGNHAADYGLLAVGDGILTAASAYPMVAPFREGAFDTSAPPRLGDLAYNVASTFRVRTVVPAGLHIVTNLVDGVPKNTPDGKEITVSEGSFVRDVVLVAARDMDHETTKVGRTRVTSYYKSRDFKGGHLVLEAGVAALKSLQKRFGPYPWPELDLAEASIVGGAGGVEFCSMALIAGMFYRPPDASGGPFGALAGILGGGAGGGLFGGEGGEEGAPDAQAGAMDRMMDDQFEFVVAHEVAHQYFAGIVGNDSRRFAVVDEPLAQYAAALVLEDRHGPAAAKAALDKHVKLNYALYRTLGNPDKAAARDTQSFATPIEYAGLVYGKAPFVYAALRKSVGDPAFDAIVRGAVAQSTFRLVTTEQWTAALEAHTPTAHRPALRPLFRRYLNEAHGDQDLGVDDSGDFVIKHMFPPGMADGLADGLKGMGMTPRDVIRMIFGGGAGAGATPGGATKNPAFNPSDALHMLEQIGN